MVTLYDINPEELIKQLAVELKNIDVVKAPEWATFAKTGAGKERPPIDKNWWYMRAASVLRKVYSSGPVGVSKLRKKYSTKKNRGHKPDKVYIAGGNILRKILQQLEKAELVKYVEKGVHKGRIVTGKGQKLLNQVAKNISGNKVLPKVDEEKKEQPKVEEKQPSLEKNVGEETKKEEKPKDEVPTAAELADKKNLLEKEIKKEVEEKQPSLEKKEVKEEPKAEERKEIKENGSREDKGGEVKGASN